MAYVGVNLIRAGTLVQPLNATGRTISLTQGSSTHATIGTPFIFNHDPSSGSIVFPVTDSTAEVVTFTATDTTDGITFLRTASISFRLVDTGKSTVTANPDTAVADGQSSATIAVTLLQADGTTPVSGIPVSVGFQSVGSQIINAHAAVDASTKQTDSQGKATFTVTDTIPEKVTFSVSCKPDGQTTENLAPVTLTFTPVPGPVYPLASSITVSPDSVPADGKTAATVTVTLKDVAGTPVPGKSVSVSQWVSLSQPTGHAVIGPASGPSDASGKVTFAVTDTTAEVLNFRAKDTTDNLDLGSGGTVQFTAVVVSNDPDPSMSTVKADSLTVPADGRTADVITVMLLKSDGTPVVGYDVHLYPRSGHATVGISGVTTNTLRSDRNGTVQFLVTDSTAEAVTFNASWENLTSRTFGYLSPPLTITFGQEAPAPTGVDAAKSTVVADPAQAPADGKLSAVVAVFLRQADGTPVSGKMVSIAQGSGSHAVIGAVSGPTDERGRASFAVWDTSVENVTFTATDTSDNLTIQQTATVTFTPVVAADAAKSTAHAISVLTRDDGKTAATLIVTLLAADGTTPATGKRVTLAQSSGSHAVIGAASGLSDAHGQVTFTATDATAEDVTFTATDSTDGVTLSQTATLTFLAHPAYVSGYPDGTFKPDEPITRAQLAKVLAVALGLDTAGAPAAGFPDVAADHWAYAYVNAVRAKKLVAGFPDGSFQPDGQVTHGQLAAIVARQLGLQPVAGAGSHWAAGYIAAIRQAGFLKDFADQTYDPDAPATRAEVVVLVEEMTGRQKATGNASVQFTDVPSTYWAAAYIQDATHEGWAP